MASLDKASDAPASTIPPQLKLDLIEMQKNAPDRPQNGPTVEPSELYFYNVKALQDSLVTDTRERYVQPSQQPAKFQR